MHIIIPKLSRVTLQFAFLMPDFKPKVWLPFFSQILSNSPIPSTNASNKKSICKYQSQVFQLAINNMNNLFIRQTRILLHQSLQKQQQLSLKLGIATQIYKISHLFYNSFCRRWEIAQDVKVAWPQGTAIELELYYQEGGASKVVGEGIIDMCIFSGHFNQQIKIALTYEGLMVGWLYCVLVLQGGSQEGESKFLCIYKITFSFIEEEDQTFTIQILQNTSLIFQKEFRAVPKDKTIFPNIKQPIHYSDVISLCLLHQKKQFKNVSFLVDHVKRGKTTYFESWIRNKHNNRTGDLKLEYFLQNLFLDNDRKMISRKGLYHAVGSTDSNILKSTDKNLQESDPKAQSKELQRQSKVSKQVEKLVRNKKVQLPQKQKKSEQSLLHRTPFEHLTQEMTKNQNGVSCLRQSKTKFIVSKNKLTQKAVKKEFQFQNIFQL